MAKVNMPSKRQSVKKVPQKELKPIPDPINEIEEIEEAEVIKDNKPVFLRVCNCRVLNVRSEPTKESKIVATIQNGTIVRVDQLSTDTSWLHITGFGDKSTVSSNSRSGYILAEYTSEV